MADGELTDSPLQDQRTWRVGVGLFVPKFVPMPAGGGLPQQLDFQSRMPAQARVYGDLTVAIRKSTRPPSPVVGPRLDVEEVLLVTEVPDVSDPMSAVVACAQVVTSIVDQMSFEMGAPLAIGHAEAIDVTPPVTIGEHRTLGLYASSPFDQNARTVEMQAIQGRILGRLPDHNPISDSKTTAVLRWFVKALGTQFLHDQFIFLWIGLEILCDASDVRGLEPYRCDCGHEFGACPDCEKPTTKIVRGATIRMFICGFGVAPEDAAALWRMRQMMHGAVRFDSEKLERLPSLLQVLRAVVAAGLKQRLGKDTGDPPLVAPSGMSIHPALGLGGTREITSSDIDPL